MAERSTSATLERLEQLETLLKAIVITWDADRTTEFLAVIAQARKVMGFKLAAPRDGADV